MKPTRLLWPILFVAVLTAGILLVLANPAPLTVELYFLQFTYPTGMVLLLTLLAGICVSFLLGGATLLYYRQRVTRLQRTADAASEEVQNLRQMIVREED